jgi:hypothetical protein
MLLATALLSLAPGQALARQAPAADGARLDRMVVIGASMAAGFGASRNLAEVFEATIRTPHKTVMGLGDVLFFTSPHASGARQVEAALDLEPTLVVGIDFLFWFGYGNLDAQGGPIERDSERLELLEAGLALLERIPCPLVVGDFPDMSGAVGKMLAPEQMPQISTLPLLSRRVREWAAARKDTVVLPLAEMVALLASPQEFRMGRHSFPAGSKMLLMDQLHASLKGIVAVSQVACDELVKHGLAREEDFEFEIEKVMERLGKGSAVPAGGSPKR